MYEQTYCSECGQEQGPAESGVSSCKEHRQVLTDKDIYDMLQDIDDDYTIFDVVRIIEAMILEKIYYD